MFLYIYITIKFLEVRDNIIDNVSGGHCPEVGLVLHHILPVQEDLTCNFPGLLALLVPCGVIVQLLCVRRVSWWNEESFQVKC